MAVDVVMPQMGESIAEGTVTKWMKKQGDRVERDEPLFEISTDKVDAEIPSPASGILSEILAPEGKTVPVNSVVARLQTEGGATAGAPKSEDEKTLEQPKPGEAKVTEAKAPEAKAPEAKAPEAKAAQQSTGQEVAQQAPSAAPPPPSRPQPVPATASMAAPRPAPAPQRESQPSDKVASLDERRRTRSSPLVRKIARENDVDIAQIEGTGFSGRVTKRDILQYLESPQTQEQDFEPEQQQPRRAAEPGERRPTPALTQRTETMSVMRKRIADHMVASRRTSAHVTTVFEVDFTEVDKLRRRYKKGYEERGAKLTYLPFIVQAVITAIREFPVINASIDGDKVVYHGEVNVGIAVALDWGLIVPVLRHADEKNVLGLARAIADLGERARQKKLNPEEVQGGTFTITNPGIFGGLFGTPIINQPQVAILGVGGVKKRAVVIETEQGDAIVVRSMAYLALSFDHRLIDGAVADQFMARVKEIIEAGDFAM